VPEEDFHLSDQMRFQAHGARASRPHSWLQCIAATSDRAGAGGTPALPGRPRQTQPRMETSQFHPMAAGKVEKEARSETARWIMHLTPGPTHFPHGRREIAGELSVDNSTRTIRLTVLKDVARLNSWRLNH